MSFIPTANAVRVALQGVVNSNDAVNTLWFLGLAPASDGDLVNLALALEAWYTDNLTPLNSHDFALNSIYLVAQDSLSAPSLLHVGDLPSTGTVSSPIVSPQTAPVIKFSTPNRGRSGRGRNYIIGCPLASLASPGVLSTGAEANYIEAYSALPAAALSAGFNHVVVSHQFDGAPLLVGNPQLVSAYTFVSASLGTQRRRRIGIGS
jgi:hypothetical protein